MSAIVLSYEEGRKRFASRIRSREDRKEVRSSLALRRWSRDLERWPKPYREAVRPFLESATSIPKIDHVWLGVRGIEAARAGTPGLFHTIGSAADSLSRCIREWKDAKTKGHRGWITRRRRALEEAKRYFRWTLWLNGRRELTPKERANCRHWTGRA